MDAAPVVFDTFGHFASKNAFADLRNPLNEKSLPGVLVTAEARAFAEILLRRHRTRCRPLQLATEAVTMDDIRSCTINYGDLCGEADARYLTRAVGKFLGEIAEWCAANGWPPLNSLAVTKETGMPGEGYDGAGDYCSLRDWERQVKDCIAFTGYPGRP